MVERDISKRWEKGIEHHQRSKEIMDALEFIDSNYCFDNFCWKIGRDGNNGETLMYELDIYFECLDAGEPLYG